MRGVRLDGARHVLSAMCALATVAMAPPPPEQDLAQFQAYRVPVLKGPRAAPVFTGKSSRWRLYRTVLREGFRDNEPFAGHYVLIVIGCGASCRNYAVGDLRTGAVHDFPRGGETNMELYVRSRPDSRLAKVEWADMSEDASRPTYCVREDMLWDGKRFRVLRSTRVLGHCED